jgi:hypothetical protein
MKLIYPILPMVTNVLLMVTNILPMLINVYSMLDEKLSVANLLKVGKIDEKWNKDGLATLLLPMNYPIPWYYQ